MDGKKNILVVDDSSTLRAAIRSELETAGYEVEEIANGWADWNCARGFVGNWVCAICPSSCARPGPRRPVCWTYSEPEPRTIW